VVAAKPDPLPFYAGIVAAVGIAGVLGAVLLPQSSAGRLGALLGVAAAASSGLVALPLKRRALRHSIQSALKLIGVVFAVRAILVAAGLVFVSGRGAGPIPFTVGFFGPYFVLQWVEISYLMAEQKRRQGA
jgi:hypothetical protein